LASFATSIIHNLTAMRSQIVKLIFIATMMLFIVLPPAEAKNWDFTVKLSNLVVQRPTTAVISAVLCFLIATFLGSLRQFGKWYLSTMHPVLVTDERGQCEEIMVDMPPGIISGISYIDRDSHGPTRRLKLIRLVLWLPLVITAFYAGAVGAILIQIDLNPLLIFFFIQFVRLMASSVIGRMMQPRP